MLSSSSSSSSLVEEMMVQEEEEEEKKEEDEDRADIRFQKRDYFSVVSRPTFPSRNGVGKPYEENWQLACHVDQVTDTISKTVRGADKTTVGHGFYAGTDSEQRLAMLMKGFERTGSASVFMTETQLQHMFKDRLTALDVTEILATLPKTYVSTYFKKRAAGNANNNDGYFGKKPIFYLTEVVAYLERERPEQPMSHRKGGVSPKMTAFIKKCQEKNIEEDTYLKHMHTSRIAKAMGVDPEENERLAKTMCHTDEDRATFVSPKSNVSSLQMLCIHTIVASGLVGSLNAHTHLPKASLNASLNDGLEYVKSFLWPMEVPSFDEDRVLKKIQSCFDGGDASSSKTKNTVLLLEKEKMRGMYDALLSMKLSIPSKDAFYQLFAQRCIDECFSLHLSEETTCDLGLTEDEMEYLMHLEERDVNKGAKLTHALETLNRGKRDLMRFFVCVNVSKFAGFNMSSIDTNLFCRHRRHILDDMGLESPSTSTLKQFLMNVLYWKNPKLATDDGHFLNLNNGKMVSQRFWYKRAIGHGFYEGDLIQEMGRSPFKACDNKEKKGLMTLLKTYNTPERYMAHVLEMLTSIFGLSVVSTVPKALSSLEDNDKHVYFTKNKLPCTNTIPLHILYLPTHMA
jgi:hypothetical protein